MNYNSYDNYSTTSYSAQGGAGGGGFIAGGSQNSPSTTRSVRDDTLRPVTIKQLNDAESLSENDFRLDGASLTQVTLVAQVRNISSQTTNTTYRLDDGTGIIEAKQWQDMDAGEDGAKAKVIENGYVRVWGKLRIFGNKRHLSAHIIRPITDFNEISYHLLEATAVHLHFTKGPPNGAAGAKGAAGGQQDTNMGGYGGGGGGGGDMPTGLSTAARKVYECLKTTPQSNEGLHVEDIASRLGMNTADVGKGGDELLERGHIYTTVDDNTWAILDS